MSRATRKPSSSSSCLSSTSSGSSSPNKQGAGSSNKKQSNPAAQAGAGTSKSGKKVKFSSNRGQSPGGGGRSRNSPPSVPPLPKKDVKKEKFVPPLANWQKGGPKGNQMPPVQGLWKDSRGRPAAWRQARVHPTKPQVRGLARKKGEKGMANPNYGLWIDDAMRGNEKFDNSPGLPRTHYKRDKDQPEDEKNIYGTKKDGCTIQ